MEDDNVRLSGKKLDDTDCVYVFWKKEMDHSNGPIIVRYLPGIS